MSSRMNRVTSALLITLTIANLALSAESTKPETRPRLTPGNEASCLLKITCDPAVLPLTPEVVESLLRSSPILKEALRSLYGDGMLDVEEIDFVALGDLVFSGRPGPALGGGGGVGGMEGGGAYGGPPMFGPMGPGDQRAPAQLGGGAGMPGGRPHFTQPPAVTTIDDSTEHRELTLLGTVQVRVEAEAGANELLLSICERLRNALNEVHKMELSRAEQRTEIASKEVAIARDRLGRLQETRRKLLEKAGQIDLSREAVVEMSRRLEFEKQEVALKLDSARMRKEALERQIAEVGAKVKELREKPEHPNLAAARAKLDMLRQKVEQVKQRVAAGRAPSIEGDEATAELAAAQAEWATKIEETISLQGGARLAKLNDELAELSIQMTEYLGRMEAIEKRLQDTRPLLNSTDIYEVDIVLEWPLVRQSYERARLYEESVQRRLRGIRPPAVMVVGEGP